MHEYDPVLPPVVYIGDAWFADPFFNAASDPKIMEKQKITRELAECAKGLQSSDQECQDLIEEAIAYFKINMPDGANIVITFVPDLTDDSSTVPVIIDGTIYIKIGPKSFSSFGWLGSSIDHELCHTRQLLGWSCFRAGGYGGKIVYTGPRLSSAYLTQGANMNEVEAYDYELSRAKYFGLTTNEIAELERRRNFYFDPLNPENKDAITNHHNYYCEVDCEMFVDR